LLQKGGMFLGGMLSQLLNISIIETVNIESYQGKENKKLKVLKEARFDLPSPLIIDEIIDSGKTIEFLVSQYKAPTAVLFYKPGTAVIKPDYYLHETDKWVKFPWEVTL
jgi:xanthine phosphoribosyltransferase